LILSTRLQDLVRNSVKEVDYDKILRGDVAVMSLFGSGAGTIVKKTDKEMYVLTCYHVIEEIVKFNNSGFPITAVVGYTLDETGDSESLKSFVSYSATVAKYDEKVDLALLKVNYSDPNLEEIKIAENEPKKGDTVYSVGSPLGLLRTVSKGILANKIEGFFVCENVTTFGNSGGGLYNKDGELIGVPSNVMGYAGGLDKEGKVTFVPESSLGLSRDLPTIKEFLKGVNY
jgi:S1-C subfamily serine protease